MDTASARILDAATRLFAERGFDGTSTRLIADAAGINIATVNYHHGGKRDLYLAVMERAHHAENTALQAAMAAFTPDRDGVHRLVDDYLDFCAAHPEVPALWMHRWLSDADDVASLEARYVRPLVDAITALVRRAVPPGADVDVEYTVWTVIWCVHGFARGGVLDDSGARQRTGDDTALARFRAQLHRIADGLLPLEAAR